jgi:hypothetical protein
VQGPRPYRVVHAVLRVRARFTAAPRHSWSIWDAPLAIEEQASASSAKLADRRRSLISSELGPVGGLSAWANLGREGQDGKMREVAERALIPGATRPTYAIRRDREGLAGFPCHGPKFLEPRV